MRQQRQRIFNKWYNIVAPEFEKGYWQDLRKFLMIERQRYRICPELTDVFKAYTLTNPHDVQVVIVGQDPYVQVDKKCIADGLAFSTMHHTTPNSLNNLISEISRDLQISPIFGLNFQNNLQYLASRRVLLLNTYLTSRANQSLSHRPENSDYGTLRIRWDMFTGNTLRHLSLHRKNLVFVLMGSEAHELGANWIRNRNDHLIIETTHPTSKSFKYGKKALWGSSFVTRSNDYLKRHGYKPITYTLF